MRTFMVAMVSGLAALVGLAGAANANETVRLEWQGTGGLNFIIPTGVSSTFLVLDVIIISDAGDTDGSLGGEISIDYTQGAPGKVINFGCVDGPGLGFDFITFIDTGTVLHGVGASTINALTCPGPAGCVLSTCTFHKQNDPNNALLTTFYDASLGEGVSNLPAANFPTGFGTARVINTPEPGALAMLGLGFGGLILGRNRKS